MKDRHETLSAWEARLRKKGLYNWQIWLTDSCCVNGKQREIRGFSPYQTNQTPPCFLHTIILQRLGEEEKMKKIPCFCFSSTIEKPSYEKELKAASLSRRHIQESKYYSRKIT